MMGEESTEKSKTLVVTPGKPLRGEVGLGCAVSLPGDKSLSHRAALFAALAQDVSRVENFLVAGVTQAMLDALAALGVGWQLDGRTLTVYGVGLPGAQASLKSGVTLTCGNSATTMRLLAGALSAWGISAILDGSEGLRRRPMRRIVEPLRMMGVNIQTENDCAPLTLSSRRMPLLPLDYSLPVASAQVKSCLLLAALAAQGETVLREPAPTRDHTERMLRNMGVQVIRTQPSAARSPQGYVTRLIPPAPPSLRPLSMTLPADISAAAFLIVAALITPDSEILLRGVGLNPTRTGLLDVLREMGAQIEITHTREQGGEPLGDLTVCTSPLRGTQVSGEAVVRMIDEFPAFAVAAAFAQGTTVVSQATELRYKESDRISAVVAELRRLGVEISETSDGFVVQGGKGIDGGTVNSQGDHRLAMALAVAGLAAERPVIVHGAEMIAESFPDFAAVLTALGGQVQWEMG